jgi:DNA replicative helicase MCM subunit Mcm2 (Cdc46/Mcm family)
MSSSSNADLLSAARQYLVEGLAPTPLEGKRPILPEWQKLPVPTDADLRSWFANGLGYNIGIRCGTPSGVIVLDIDGDPGKNVFDFTRRRFSSGLQSKIENTRMTKTGGNGLHVWFKYRPEDFPGGIKSSVLWRQNIQEVKPGEKAGEILVQADNKQVVVWPSKHPVTGMLYVMNDKPIQELTKEEYEELLASFGKDPSSSGGATDDSAAGDGGHGSAAPGGDSEKRGLMPEQMSKLLEAIKPFYKEGVRDSLVYGLAGMCLKGNYSQESSARFVRLLCDAYQDHERESRVYVVKQTFEKPPDKVAGFKVLHEISVELANQVAAILERGEEPDDGCGGDDDDSKRTISVGQALREEPDGTYTVYGMISTMSTVYRMVTGQWFKCTKCHGKEHVTFEMALPQPLDLRTVGYSMKCSKCNGPHIPGAADYVPAVTVELMDTDTFSEIERLTAIFFGDDTKDINVGERVSITGILRVVQNRRRGKLFTVLHTHSVEYESREKLELTSKDIGAIKRWVELVGGPEKAIEKLAALFAPDVIGYDSVKEGLLMVAASSGPDIRSKTRKRIHAALVGPPGLAKTMLLRAAAAHVPGSRFETAQQASGKSLTALVVREEEMYHLKLGPAALARQAVLAINEAGRMSEEDQSFLLDVLEEGEFTINKYGFNARIRADASVVISSNPRSTDWTATGGDDKIDLNEIPTLKELLDRIDLRFIFKAVRDEKTVREYANEKANIESRRPVNYNFIRKYIAYARGIEPRFSEGARSILSEAYVSLITSENNAFVTPRARDMLFRIAKTRARLKLKEIVGIDEAKEAVSFLNTVSQQFANTVAVPEDPHVVAYALMVKNLQKSAFGISLGELANIASDQNPQVAAYLKGGRDIGSNWRLRRVYLSLLEHTNIKQTHDRPIALQWFERSGLFGSNNNPSDVSDVSEGSGTANDNVEDVKDNKNPEKAASDASDASDRKQKQYEGPPIPCPYCSRPYDTPKLLQGHSIRSHRKKPITEWLSKNGFEV